MVGCCPQPFNDQLARNNKRLLEWLNRKIIPTIRC